MAFQRKFKIHKCGLFQEKYKNFSFHFCIHFKKKLISQTLRNKSSYLDVVERLLNLKVVYGSNKVHCGKSEPENNCQGDLRFNANTGPVTYSLWTMKTDSEDILRNRWIEVPFDTSGEMLIRAFIFLQKK